MPGHPWPLFDLRLRTPRLELRLPTDEDLLELARVARDGIVDADRTVFLVPWHKLPSPAFERQFLLHWWGERGRWSPAAWSLGLVVTKDDRAIGVQGVRRETSQSVDSSTREAGWDASSRVKGWEPRLGPQYSPWPSTGSMRRPPSPAISTATPPPRAFRRSSATVSPATRCSRSRANVHWRSRCAAPARPGSENSSRSRSRAWSPALGLFGVGELGPDEWATF